MLQKIKENPIPYLLGGVLGLGITAKLLQKTLGANKKQWFSTVDNQSLSNLNDFTTLNYNAELQLIFKQKIIKGKITYTFQSFKNNLSQIILDIKSLQTLQVQQDGQVLSFQVKKTEYSDLLGDQLIINLEKKVNQGQKFDIVIEYQTKYSEEETTALNWLEPQQTIGQEQPYLFTQCQPIFCRTIFPCQDSPSVKSTFQAQISVPRQLSAWCSGRLVKNTYNKSTEYSTFYFNQPVPIPSYLFSICAGNLEQRQVGSRCSVITEPEFIEECAEELKDMEQYLYELENYTTPYEWGEYKIVILPPSFPYGGMENPTLTFANPTIIVGDKSCTDLVVHEMAHSWSGNLVGCKDWANFWLNEGWTMFLENKINKIMNGDEHYRVVSSLQMKELEMNISHYKGDEFERYTRLVPDLKHDHPDDAFSLVPYIKGCTFLTMLEQKFGEENFKNFAKAYFTHFRNKSIDTDIFLDFVKKYITKYMPQNVERIWNSIDFNAWLYQPGMPPACPEVDYKTTLIDDVKNLAQEFVQNTKLFENPEKLNQYKNLKMLVKVIFFNTLYELREKFDVKALETLDIQLEIMSKEKNPEILYKFLVLGIYYEYKPALDHLPKFLSSVGRMKFCRPIYQEYAKNKNLLTTGRSIYHDNKNFYHSIASKMIAKDLGYKEE